MPDVAHALARSLISRHGSDAIAVAERAADNVRQLGMIDETREWEKVIDIIAAIQSLKSD